MSSPERRRQRDAEREALYEQQRDEEYRLAHLSIYNLLDESNVDDKLRLVIEAICEHVGMDVYADR